MIAFGYGPHCDEPWVHDKNRYHYLNLRCYIPRWAMDGWMNERSVNHRTPRRNEFTSIKTGPYIAVASTGSKSEKRCPSKIFVRDCNSTF